MFINASPQRRDDFFRLQATGTKLAPMLNALYAGMAKLVSYYTRTKEIHDNLYAIGTILAPQQ